MKNGFHHSQENQKGDRIGTHLAESALELADLIGGIPRSFFPILAQVTLFQYSEGYTDLQAAEAVRVRPDWKEALGLGASYPGFDPVWLCRLRRSALASDAGLAALQSFLVRQAAAGLFLSNPQTPPQAGEVIRSICRFNRLYHLTEAMLLSIEALAAQGSVQFPSLSLHHLYEAYARIYRFLPVASDPEDALHLAMKIDADITLLLSSVEAAGEDDIKTLPEIHSLRRIWEKQYNRLEARTANGPGKIWQPVDCPHCSLDGKDEFQAGWELDGACRTRAGGGDP